MSLHVSKKHPFSCQVVNHDWFIHPSVDGRWGNFQFLALMNKTSMNNFIQVFYVFISFR